MRVYLAILRCAFTARSEALAVATAEHFRQQVENVLDPDDTVDTTQVIEYGAPQAPDEILNILKRARNQLIRLKYSDTMTAAQYLDRIIWALAHNAPGEVELAPDYDWNRVHDLMKLIDKGEEPVI